MYRLVGAVLVFFTSAYVGMAFASVYRMRVEQLEAFRSLIGHIGERIEGFLSPLDEIFGACNDKRLSRIGFLEAAEIYGCTAALERCKERLFLLSGEYDELNAFFGGLGHGSAAEEVKHCRYFEKRFSEFALKAREELSGRMRLCRVLGMLIGIMLVVILL